MKHRIKGPLREIIREAIQAGWTVGRTRSNHLRFTKAGKILIAPGTPSDHRVQRHMRAAFRRAERQS